MINVKITKDFTGILKGNIKDLADKERQIRDLKLIRGNVIEVSIEIERQLNFMISDILFGGIKNRQSEIPHQARGEIRFFEDFILNTNNLTFGAKLKILRSLKNTCSFLKEDEAEVNEVVQLLQKVMEWRDNFAHGEIMFKTTQEGMSDKPYLFYYKENRPQEKILNNDFFDSVANPLYNNADTKIRALRTKLNTKFETKKPTFKFD